jgi:glycosyltransferase involved in cell wall biosynthesis
MTELPVIELSESGRIAYLVSRYPATNHTFILREIVALRLQGFDIRVIAIRGADRPDHQMTEIERREREQTFVVLPFGAHFLKAHLATALGNPAGYARGLWLAVKLSRSSLRSLFFHFIYFLEAVVAGHAARRAGCGRVHTHFSSTVGLIAERIFGFQLSITIHGPDEFRNAAGFAMHEKVARARFISTISQYARSQIMLASGPADWPKIEICRLGVDTSVFTPGGMKKRDDRKTDDVYRVISVARLAPVKAQRILIAACQQLVTAGWRLNLHLVGSGPDAESLRQFAKAAGMESHVIFEGPRNQDEVIALYRQSDVFALASFGEGVPVVLMEAMAMELPCVATWVNGVPELIRHNQEGLLVAPSDVEGLAQAIEQLLKSPELRQRLGSAGRQKVLQRYELQTNIGTLAEVFRKYSINPIQH